MNSYSKLENLTMFQAMCIGEMVQEFRGEECEFDDASEFLDDYYRRNKVELCKYFNTKSFIRSCFLLSI